MNKQKFIVVINDGKREVPYKGVVADSHSEALDIAVEKHIKAHPKVDIMDIEANCVKMATGGV